MHECCHRRLPSCPLRLAPWWYVISECFPLSLPVPISPLSFVSNITSTLSQSHPALSWRNRSWSPFWCGKRWVYINVNVVLRAFYGSGAELYSVSLKAWRNSMMNKLEFCTAHLSLQILQGFFHEKSCSKWILFNTAQPCAHNLCHFFTFAIFSSFSSSYPQ